MLYINVHILCQLPSPMWKAIFDHFCSERLLLLQAYDKNPELDNLLLDDFFRDALHKCQPSWRKVLSNAVLLGVPTPCFSTALAFYDGYRSRTLPANLIQAQRDYFGAHTYERLDAPGNFVHTNRTGKGGNVSSSTYNA